MLRFSLRKQLLTISLIVTAALILITVFIVYPSAKQTLALERDINQIQTFLEKQYQRSQKLRKSVREVDSVNELTAGFKQSTVAKGEELILITQLEKIAADTNISQNLNVKEVSDSRSYYQFSFLNHGSFEDQLRFIKSLEELSYYVIIDQLNWEKRSNDQNGGGQVTLRFDAKVYTD